MSDKPPASLFKIVIVGEGGVGKTSTILRFTTNSFLENYIPTLGASFASHEMEVDDRLAVLQIWDLGGQKHYERLRSRFYRGARGVVMVYDTTRNETYEEMSTWKKEVDSHVDDYSLVILGNKVDLITEREVKFDSGIILAEEFGGSYFETSVKLDQNVEEAFQTLVRGALEIVDRMSD
jgi:small GTP-binding protein